VSIIIDIAEEVAAEINAQAWSVPTLVAWRYYRPLFDLKKMSDLHVTVVPRGWTSETLDRARSQEDHQVDVAVQQKFARSEIVDLDPLMSLVQEIADYFLRRRLAHYEDAVCIKVENSPAYIPQHIEEMRQFTSVLTLTFRVCRATTHPAPAEWYVDADLGDDRFDGRSWPAAKASFAQVKSDPAFASNAVVHFAPHQTHVDFGEFGNLYAYTDLVLRGEGIDTELVASGQYGIMLGTRSGIENAYVHHTYSGAAAGEKWAVFSAGHDGVFLRDARVKSDLHGAVEFCDNGQFSARLTNVELDSPLSVLLNGRLFIAGLKVTQRVGELYKGPTIPLCFGYTGGVAAGSYMRDSDIFVVDPRGNPPTPMPIIGSPPPMLNVRFNGVEISQ